MITRAILEAQRGLYVKGREAAIANVNSFNGAIEAIDNLLGLVVQMEEHEAAQDAATENGGN